MTYTIQQHYSGPLRSEFTGYKVCVADKPVGELTLSLPDMTFTTVRQASDWARANFSALLALARRV